MLRDLSSAEMGRRISLGLMAAVALSVGAQAAHADHNALDIPWPQLLPPQPTPTEVQPGPVPRCRRASIQCVDQLVEHLRGDWRRYDRSCDHRAVIAFSYLKITRGLRRDLAGKGEDLVQDDRWMTYLITTFSNRYRRAFADWDAGRAVPEPWRITFRAAEAGDVNAGQDVLLFSNAHVQHDLPFALEEMGLRARDGASRKPDHDAVNAINTAVFDPIEDYISANYDPTFELIDAKPLPHDEIGTLELVKLWRETAWRNAERLLNAPTETARDRVAADIAAYSTAWARLISAPEIPGTRAQRDAFCASH
jgi:hypothetical protein